MSQRLLSIFRQVVLQPAALYSSVYAPLLMATGARPGRPRGLKGHAKCNMGSGQQRRAEIGAAGAGELRTGAKGRERRDERGRRPEERKERTG